MILTRSKILEAIKNGSIKIEPFSEDQVGPASIDLHLGNIFRPLILAGHPIVVDDEVTDAEQYSKPLHLKDNETIILKPSETVLGITKEKVTFPPDIAGRIEGRSRFARIGLAIHITSGFIHPGVSNFQVLEISNMSPNELVLMPGLKICQIVLERCEGEESYKGKFQGQTNP